MLYIWIGLMLIVIWVLFYICEKNISKSLILAIIEMIGLAIDILSENENYLGLGVVIVLFFIFTCFSGETVGNAIILAIIQFAGLFFGNKIQDYFQKSKDYFPPSKQILSISECKVENIDVMGSSCREPINDNYIKREYGAENVLKDTDDCWCEGKDDFGIGEYLYFDFKDTYRIDYIGILNGLHRKGYEERFYKNARVKKVEIEYKGTDGTIERKTAYLKSENENDAYTKIDLSSICTDYIKLTIKEVDTTGSPKIFDDKQDTCITRVSFY